MNKQSSRGIIIVFVLLVGLSPAIPAQESSETAPAVDLPSAESILDRYIEATGGREAYENRTSEVGHGKMEIATVGITGELTSYAKPGLQYVDINLAGLGKIEQGIKDGIAWENSVLQGPRIKTGDEQEAALREAIFNARSTGVRSTRLSKRSESNRSTGKTRIVCAANPIQGECRNDVLQRPDRSGDQGDDDPGEPNG